MADMGRPTVMTEDVIKKLEEAFEMDCTITEACAYADISAPTYYKKLKEDEDFSYKMTKAQERPFIKAKHIMFTTMKDANDSMKFLERRQKSLYALRTELTGADGKELLNLPDEELDSKIDALTAALGKAGVISTTGGEGEKT